MVGGTGSRSHKPIAVSPLAEVLDDNSRGHIQKKRARDNLFKGTLLTSEDRVLLGGFPDPHLGTLPVASKSLRNLLISELLVSELFYDCSQVQL